MHESKTQKSNLIKEEFEKRSKLGKNRQKCQDCWFPLPQECYAVYVRMYLQLTAVSAKMLFP